MMTIRRVSQLAQILRDSLEYNNAASEEVLAHAAIALSFSEWDELRAQPEFFAHMDPEGVVMFHGIRIASRTKITVRA